MKSNAKQIGGSHYRAGIQHWDLITVFGVPYLEGCATKYLTRFEKKNGVQDLDKAIHYIEKLIEIEEQPVTTLEWVKVQFGKALRLELRRPAVPIEVVSRFVSENDVPIQAETAIIYLLRWQTVDDLYMALHAAQRARDTLTTRLAAQSSSRRLQSAAVAGTDHPAPFGYDREIDA